MPPMTILTLDPDTTLNFVKTANTTSPMKVMKLTNNHNGHVAFKVKTTAPKAYLVRPSNGTLKPKETQEVSIILQAQTAGDAANPDRSNTDRFLVHAVAVKDSEPVSREEWNNFPKETLHEQKLNVKVFSEEQDDTSEQPKGPTGPVGGAAKLASGSTDIQAKYDDLVDYTLKLEREKKKLEADLAKALPGAPRTYSGVVLVGAVLVAFMVPYIESYIGIFSG